MATINMNTNTNANTENKNGATASEVIESYKKTYGDSYYDAYYSKYKNSYNAGSGYSSYNAYPSTKNTHSFEAVLTEDFKKILKMDQTELKQYLFELLKTKGYNPNFRDGFIYAKGDIPVMLVAHMDTVHKSKVKEIYVSDCGNITSPQGIGGDDRCGIYMITQLMQHKPYILFTEEEEVGGVGAKKFASAYDKSEIEDINVKYIIELDRKGCNDMVFYDCDNPEFEKYIGKFGWDNRWGSYSDICSVAPVIGAAAVNLSSGYYKPHTTEEIINIDDVMTNIKRVRKMIKASVKDEVPSFKYIANKYSYDDYCGYGSYKSTTVNSTTVSSPSKTITMETVNDKNDKKEADTKETDKTESKEPISFWDYCKKFKIDADAETAQSNYAVYLRNTGFYYLANQIEKSIEEKAKEKTENNKKINEQTEENLITRISKTVMKTLGISKTCKGE